MIYVEDNSIKVGNVLLPGLYRSLEIVNEATVDDMRVEGVKKVPRQATGYEDIKITLTIELADSEKVDRWEKLNIIQNVFREPKKGAKPKVYPFISRHTQIRGISKVLFKKLSSVENSRNQSIILQLEFLEYVDVKITAKTAVRRSKGSSTKSGSGKRGNLKSGKSATRPQQTKEYQRYLARRGKSPSVDDRIRNRARMEGLQ